MNSRHPFFSVLALVICLPLAFPADVAAQATQPQHAGRITAVLPIVNVIRGPRQTPASTSEEVFWGDIINTGHLARARVSLDDGSVLSVGSDSNLTVTKHDAASQQTDLDLNYGRVRAKAVKLVKPNASFQIRTPTGVAGVVGTDFALDSQGDTTRIVVYEGKVNFCALVSEKKKQDDQQGAVPEAQPPVNGDQDQQKKRRRGVVGPCVIVGSGEASSVQFNSVPTPPVPATPMTLTDMANTTAPGGAVGAGGGISAGAAVGIGVGAAAAAAVAAVVVRAVSKTPTCPTATAAEAAHVAPEASCAARSKSAIGKVPGQRP